MSRQSNFPDQIIEGLLYIADHARRDPLTRYVIDPDGTNLGRRMIASGTSAMLRAALFDPYLDAAVANNELPRGLPRADIYLWLGDVVKIVMRGLEDGEGDLKRYRLDYEAIKAINPGIIYCSVTGFGQTGPYAPRAGYDAILQAMGGLMSVTGHLDGEPGAGPMKVGPSIVDYMTGMNSSIGILSALYHRKANGGEGQHVDVCLFDTVIASLSHYAQIFLVNGQTPPRRGTWGNGGMPAGVFRCTDGELMLVVGNDGQFQRTCAVLGAPELATDPKFLKNNDRVVHGKEIMAIFAGLFLKKPVAYWLRALKSEDRWLRWRAVRAGSVHFSSITTALT
jgi:hypothetical protein